MSALQEASMEVTFQINPSPTEIRICHNSGRTASVQSGEIWPIPVRGSKYMIRFSEYSTNYSQSSGQPIVESDSKDDQRRIGMSRLKEFSPGPIVHPDTIELIQSIRRWSNGPVTITPKGEAIVWRQDEDGWNPYYVGSVNVDPIWFQHPSRLGHPGVNGLFPTPESYLGKVSCIGPRACYDESKRLAETISILYFQQYNVPVKIARPFNVYGPYLNLNDGRIIPDFMNNAINKSQIIIHSDGSPTRSFCYASDAISGFFKLLFSNHNGIICNVGNDEEVSVKDVADIIQNIMNKPISIKMEKSEDPNYTKDNPQRRCPDLSLIKKSVNYKPIVNLEEGLKRVYMWYRSN